MISWQWRTFEKLNNQELYDILALRQEVFVLEQKCLYPDIDNRDSQAIHLLGMSDKKLAAYLRLFLKGTFHANAISFGRVATAPFARNQGLGKSLIAQTLLYLKDNNLQDTIRISAQIYLKKFYESFGFQSVGEMYDEDGIMHIDMIKKMTFL